MPWASAMASMPYEGVDVVETVGPMCAFSSDGVWWARDTLLHAYICFMLSFVI